MPDANQNIPPAVQSIPDVPIEVIKPLNAVKAVKKKDKRHTGSRMAPARAYAIRALVDSGFPLDEIVKREHVSPNTVYAIKNSDRFDPKRVESIKQSLSAHFYDRAHTALETITQEKLDKSSALQLMTVAAIGTDKARLIEGKATARTEYMNVEDKAVQDEIARLEGELDAWKNGEILNAEGSEGQDATPTGQHAPQTIDKGSNGGQ